MARTSPGSSLVSISRDASSESRGTISVPLLLRVGSRGLVGIGACRTVDGGGVWLSSDDAEESVRAMSGAPCGCGVLSLCVPSSAAFVCEVDSASILPYVEWTAWRWAWNGEQRPQSVADEQGGGCCFVVVVIRLTEEKRVEGGKKKWREGESERNRTAVEVGGSKTNTNRKAGEPETRKKEECLVVRAATQSRKTGSSTLSAACPALGRAGFATLNRIGGTASALLEGAQQAPEQGRLRANDVLWGRSHSDENSADEEAEAEKEQEKRQEETAVDHRRLQLPRETLDKSRTPAS